MKYISERQFITGHVDISFKYFSNKIDDYEIYRIFNLYKVYGGHTIRINYEFKI